MANWTEINQEVTFVVRFTKKTGGGLLKFEGDIQGSVPGYTLKWGARSGAYFVGPKDAPSSLDAAFENLSPAQKAAIAAILGQAPEKKTRRSKS